MRRVWMCVAGIVVVLSLSATARAQTVRFNVTLSGANEAPEAITTGSFGIADVTWHSGTRTLSWVIDVFNMPSGTTAAHFHVGGPGVAGPIVVPIEVPVTISNDFRVAGSASCDDVMARAAQGINSCEDFEQSLLGEQIYVNVHSANNPSGEIRGQVLRRP